MPLGFWTRVDRRKQKFNRIRQVAPMCGHERTHWRHLVNSTEPSVCSGDAVLCQITLTTCLNVEGVSVTGTLITVLRDSTDIGYADLSQTCTALCVEPMGRGNCYRNHLHGRASGGYLQGTVRSRNTAEGSISFRKSNATLWRYIIDDRAGQVANK